MRHLANNKEELVESQEEERVCLKQRDKNKEETFRKRSKMGKEDRLVAEYKK